MRIISKFHDYYDSVQKYGQDKSLVYARKEEFFQPDSQGRVKEFFGPFSTPRINWKWFNDDLQTGLRVYGFYIAFCGTIYPGLRLTYPRFSIAQSYEAYCYSVEDGLAFLNRYRIPILYMQRRHEVAGPVNEGSLHRYFHPEEGPGGYSTAWRDSMPLHREHKCPIILSAEVGAYAEAYETKVPRGAWNHVVKNPCLKKLEFFRVVDTNKAYQELQIFLGGIMNREERPMVAVSEKTRIEKRGFDKWSFRKLPTKKRK